MPDFNTRFTHALLMAILVVLTRMDPRETIFGEIGRDLYPIILATLCFMWAWGLPKLRAWSER